LSNNFSATDEMATPLYLNGSGSDTEVDGETMAHRCT
jgi:hypothetical protein